MPSTNDIRKSNDVNKQRAKTWAKEECQKNKEGDKKKQQEFATQLNDEIIKP